MTCINLGELSEYEAKLKFYMMSYMRQNVWLQYVDYDNEEEVTRWNINMFSDFTLKMLLRKDEDMEKIDASSSNMDLYLAVLISHSKQNEICPMSLHLVTTTAYTE